jgi:hypothetical protein
MSSPPYPAIDREFAWKSFEHRLNLAKEILSFKVHFLNKCFKSVDNVEHLGQDAAKLHHARQMLQEVRSDLNFAQHPLGLIHGAMEKSDRLVIWPLAPLAGIEELGENPSLSGVHAASWDKSGWQLVGVGTPSEQVVALRSRFCSAKCIQGRLPSVLF